MIANTQPRSDKTGPTLRGHSIDLDKVLKRSDVNFRHTKVRKRPEGLVSLKRSLGHEESSLILTSPTAHHPHVDHLHNGARLLVC